jgi:hypothetical protein
MRLPSLDDRTMSASDQKWLIRPPSWWRNAQALMDANEVVMHEVDCNRIGVVFGFF